MADYIPAPDGFHSGEHMREGCEMSRRQLCNQMAVGLWAVACAGCIPTSMPQGANAVLPATKAVELQLVAEGLNAPIALAEAPDASGRLFIADQEGLIRIVDADGRLLRKPFLDLRQRVVTGNERGLLGFAFHPRFGANRRVFVFFNAERRAPTPDDYDSEVHLVEFQESADDANSADPKSERPILRVGKPHAHHNGGQLVFGPDGYLYIGIGDGGAPGDAGPGHTPGIGNAQDKTKLLGKILRIDVDNGDPYAIPPDNPFVDDAQARPEIYAYGLRNPYRFSFDAPDGAPVRLFVGDVGQSLFEEVNLVDAGGNYGWNIHEGAHCFNPQERRAPLPTCAHVAADRAPLIEPILEYAQYDPQGAAIGNAVIGGFVYRGSAIPKFRGAYLFGDFTGDPTQTDGVLFEATENEDESWTLRELAVRGRQRGRLERYVLSFGRDQAGELYVLTSRGWGSSPGGTTGAVFKLVPAPD